MKDHKKEQRPRQFDLSLSLEEQERRAREEKIHDLLPDEDEALGKAYDSRLVRRLLGYTLPYKGQLIAAVSSIEMRAVTAKRSAGDMVASLKHRARFPHCRSGGGAKGSPNGKAAVCALAASSPQVRCLWRMHPAL